MRDASGRFLKGNPGGPGDPAAGRRERLRHELLRAVTPRDIGQIASVLIDQARAGELAAARLLFEYTIGKAGTFDTERARHEVHRQASVVVEQVLARVPDETKEPLFVALDQFIAEAEHDGAVVE